MSWICVMQEAVQVKLISIQRTYNQNTSTQQHVLMLLLYMHGNLMLKKWKIDHSQMSSMGIGDGGATNFIYFLL